MRKNIYGRRRWNSSSNKKPITNNFRSNNSNNSAFAKHKELLDRATRTSDPIDKINLMQRAEHYLKISNGVEF